MVNICIIEDHPMVVDGLKSALSGFEYIHIAGCAYNAKDGLAIVKEFQPDVVIMDIRLPDKSGIELCKELMLLMPSLGVIALTTYLHRFYIQSMIDSGAKAYLLKSSPASEIIEAITTVADGNEYFSEEVKAQLRSHSDQPVYVSRREKEVLKLIAEGLTNQEIAEKLFISPLTVDSHRKNLIAKFGAKNTASLISIAMNGGYLS